MMRAIELAREADRIGEVPIGAVVVKDGKIIGEEYNTRETRRTATGHAEIMAIEAACKARDSWHLDGCTLYVTLEPCPMCTGAILSARIKTVVYSLIDLRSGAMGGKIDLSRNYLNHTVDTISGVCEEESLELLEGFFNRIRNGSGFRF